MSPLRSTGSSIPIEESYRTLIKMEWADLHHSRVQEWSALGVITGAHLALTQIPKVLGDLKLPMDAATIGIIASLFGFMFAIVGAMVTCRHRRLMYIKLTWIYEAEEKLGLIKDNSNPGGIIPNTAKIPENISWRGLMWPRLLSTSSLILLLYILFGLFDLACLILCLVS